MKKQAKKLTEVRIGVIGVGNMGTSHISNIERGLIGRARLTAICDIVPSKMDRYGDKYLKFTDSRALIRSGEVDAVMVETPHYDHTTIGIDALSNGIHTLVEKPISVHKADCERLIAAHKDKKVVFSAMFNQRTDPHYIKLREIIKSGQLGEIARRPTSTAAAGARPCRARAAACSSTSARTSSTSCSGSSACRRRSARSSASASTTTSRWTTW